MTRKAAVIGHPVGHSKSPLIHTHWIEKYGLDAAYEAIDIPPDSLESGVRDLIHAGYAGFNVTLPHKEKIMPLCPALDATARAVGAVNTVLIQDGKLTGRNTDVFGFIQNIRTAKPDFDFKAGPAVVLGAGGAARAVVYALLQEGAPSVFLTNRTLDKARHLAADFPGALAQEWAAREKILEGSNLLVNTTALGMKGQAALEIDLSGLPLSALVHDIIYAPLETDLLRQAMARGNPVVTGIGMLLHQARPAFEAWFGILPDIDAELERKVLE